MGTLKSAAFDGEESVQYVDPKQLKPTGILHFTIGVSDLDKARVGNVLARKPRSGNPFI